jgi:hypothetical protein
VQIFREGVPLDDIINHAKGFLQHWDTVKVDDYISNEGYSTECHIVTISVQMNDPRWQEVIRTTEKPLGKAWRYIARIVTRKRHRKKADYCRDCKRPLPNHVHANDCPTRGK